ncbi:uncharacterized protein LOC132607811 [Lycium barbarum]|uniref:uncharacterized protein LOC132607811 n=1 Tax=Lycium barbarum TaxID=112863 RepID=UPI00293F36F2|nr:uncharacterized protein LOC132607811 [Lycium barbarum]
MEVLLNYQIVSGQRMNRDKSCFYMYKTCAMSLVQDVTKITSFTIGEFPFKYLGYPIFHSRKKKAYYNDLINKVKDRLQNRKGKLMSFGDKVVLINSVVQSMPMYFLSAMVPTKYTIQELHRIFARFYGVTMKIKGIDCYIQYFAHSDILR